MHLNTAQNKLARLAAQTIIRHVRGGGFLGASWPQYTCGWLDQPVLDEAMRLAEETCPTLWQEAQENFEREARQAEAALQVVQQHWLVLDAAPEEAVDPILTGLASAYNLPVEALRAAHAA